MAPPYATTEELSNWLGNELPANADRLLRYANALVRRATLTAVYETDLDGSPADAAIAQALRDATTAQVEVWLSLSIDPVAGAADGGRVVASKALGPANIQYATYAATAEARARAARRLCDLSYSILLDAGLVGESPVIYG